MRLLLPFVLIGAILAVGCPSSTTTGKGGTTKPTPSGKMDTGKPAPTPDTGMKPMTLTVTYEKGSLMGRWDPPPYPEWREFALIRIADNWFIPGFLLKGELWEVAREMVLEFSVKQGRATAFEVRDETDKLMAMGKRKS